MRMASRPPRKRMPSKVQLQQSPPPIFHISLLLLLLAATCSSPLAVVRAEDADSEQVFTGKTAVSSASSSSPPSSTQPEEAAVLIFFCTLYAICVSIVAVGFGYFAFLEDKMMRVYLRHGHSLQSTVVSADFSRGAVAPTTTACGGASDGDNDHDHDAAHGAGAGAGAGAADCYTCGAGGAPSSDSSCVAAANAARDHEEQQEQHHHHQNSTRTPVVVKAEYNIVIEYKVDNHENYKSKVRKQVKALGSDFVKPIPPCIHVEMIEFRIDEATASPTASPSFLTRTDSHIASGTNGEHHHQHHHQQQAADRLQLKQHHQCSAITSHLIPILVLDDYPKSAIPVGHVQRACSWRYKLPTVMLVAIMLAFAWFCLLLAADVMYPTSLFSWTGGAAKDEEAILAMATTFSRGQVFMLVGVLLLGLVLLEAVCVHYLMGETLSASIRETYLEGVDQGSMSTDETTLSSGDDTYLMV